MRPVVRLVLTTMVLIGFAAASGTARERGGQLSYEEKAYFNDIYGIALEFPDLNEWEFELKDLGTEVRGEYVLTEILKARFPDSDVRLLIKVATDPVLLGTGMSNWDYYSSLRRVLEDPPKNESVEYTFLHGFYEGICWRYTGQKGSATYRFINFLVRRPGANFCLTFYAPVAEMDRAWEDVSDIADTVRFYDTILLGGDLKRIFLDRY